MGVDSMPLPLKNLLLKKKKCVKQFSSFELIKALEI